MTEPKPLHKFQKELIQKIQEMAAAGEIVFPENYSYVNAIRSAFMIMEDTKDKSGKSIIERINSQSSISKGIIYMVSMGLNPSKNQVYLIEKHGKLNVVRSYFGTVAMLKRIDNILDVNAEVIFEGDEFSYTMKQARKIVNHEQSFERLGSKIRGAYATIVYRDSSGVVREASEVMNEDEIKEAWKASKTKLDGVHKNYPQEMRKRTVLNRACKMHVNTSDDSSLDFAIHSFNNTHGMSEDAPPPNEGEVIDVPVEE